MAKSSLSALRPRALPNSFATPFDRVAAGAEVFATAIGNLMAGDGLARTPSTRHLDADVAIALPVLMIALMAMQRAATGFALASLVFALWLARSLSRLRQWLLAQRCGAARVGRAADGRLRRRPVDCRTPRGHENCRREFDAGQVSVAAPSRSASERARFSGKAGPPGCRGDVRGPVRVDGGLGGART